MIGKTLGHYEISGRLGKGGMGEVYQAKDQKLGRDVAIKVLPEEFAKDTDRVARFQREAKVLASLNHSNIAAIYGLEESGGTNFLVMELVEGETLAAQLTHGPVPVAESMKLALQIAEALEAAHEKGIIHRDLKPANIKVTPDGKVKVLDFGLAKAFAGEQADLNLSNSPTLSNAATQQGVILGTAAYMSPEQARGKPVDKRTDIWAFGCVLFEMLTGQATFQGEDVTEILASVVKSGVNLDLLPANIHPRVHEVISRCLQKDAKDRYRDIGDARFEIRQILADPSGILVQPITTKKPRKKVRLGLPWVAAIAILCIIIAGILGWNLRTPEPRQVMRFEYELPEGQQFSNVSLNPSLAVSPDGRQIVYSTLKGLYLRSVDEWTAKLISGTEGDTFQPFFSPDGKSIGYLSRADLQLKKISINGGAPIKLCSVSTAILGVCWRADNTIVYGQGPGDIMKVSASGGIPEPLVKAKSLSSVYPHILPDGKSVLYTDSTGTTHGIVMVRSLESGEVKELFPGFSVGYLPTGHIIYGLPNDDNLYAVMFDIDTMEVKGDPVLIVERVMGHGVQCAVSDTGTLVYISGRSIVATANQLTLVWVDRKGKEEPFVAASPGYYRFPRISPDGKKVAISATSGGNADIYIWDLIRKTMNRLTFDEGQDNAPLWTPDGKRIAFTARRSGKASIYWKAEDGSGGDELLFSGSGIGIRPGSWADAGRTLVFMETGEGLKPDIGAVSMEGDRAKRFLLHEKYAEADPQISPDGQWMAFSSDRSGKYEVYVSPYPEVKGGMWQVSEGGGDWPLWSRDGRELFYRSGDTFMAVSVKTEPTFNRETPKAMFRGTYAQLSDTAFANNWDVSPDGKRFLMIKDAETSASTGGGPRKINIVLNWFEELKQRVPKK